MLNKSGITPPLTDTSPMHPSARVPWLRPSSRPSTSLTSASGEKARDDGQRTPDGAGEGLSGSPQGAHLPDLVDLGLLDLGRIRIRRDERPVHTGTGRP